MSGTLVFADAAAHENDARAPLVRWCQELEDYAKPGNGWRLAFDLAQRIRLELPWLDAIRAVEILATLVELDAPWWSLFGFPSSDDAEESFLDGWERLRFFDDTFEAAVREGLSAPATLPRRLSRPRTLPAFVGVLHALQRASQPRPVLLSQAALARALGVDQATVSRWVRRLRREGLLRLEREYWHPEKPDSRLDEDKRQRASTYWVDGLRLQGLAEEAARERSAAIAASTEGPSGLDHASPDSPAAPQVLR